MQMKYLPKTDLLFRGKYIGEREKNDFYKLLFVGDINTIVYFDFENGYTSEIYYPIITKI